MARLDATLNRRSIASDLAIEDEEEEDLLCPEMLALASKSNGAESEP
jgi:hypothetical protein